MAECSISLPFAGSQDQLYDTVQQALAKQGGTMSGSKAYGNISLPTPAGTVTGTYRTAPGRINVDITDKPFLVSCTRIDSELRKGLALALAKQKPPSSGGGAAPSGGSSTPPRPPPTPTSTTAAAVVVNDPADPQYWTFEEGETITVQRPKKPAARWPLWLSLALVAGVGLVYARSRA